jgi:alpha-beta hydrolase superfamily lysophospholipase
MAFGKFNNAFKPTRTEFDWLSRDGEEVDKYVADPHCGFLATNELWVELLDALPHLTDSEHLARIPRDLPIYVFSGALDPVGESSESVKELLVRYERAGLSHVSHRLYSEGRHEMFNETNRDQVVTDLLSWLGEVLD